MSRAPPLVFCILVVRHTGGSIGSTPVSEVGTADRQRQCRIRALEELHRLISGLDEKGVMAATPNIESLLLLMLKLTNDRDFKIVGVSLVQFFCCDNPREWVEPTLVDHLQMHL